MTYKYITMVAFDDDTNFYVDSFAFNNIKVVCLESDAIEQQLPDDAVVDAANNYVVLAECQTHIEEYLNVWGLDTNNTDILPTGQYLQN